MPDRMGIDISIGKGGVTEHICMWVRDRLIIISVSLWTSRTFRELTRSSQTMYAASLSDLEIAFPILRHDLSSLPVVSRWLAAAK